MKEIVRELELTLGPGTGDLSMRIGLHSVRRHCAGGLNYALAL
jgi:hypothetical protein